MIDDPAFVPNTVKAARRVAHAFAAHVAVQGQALLTMEAAARRAAEAGAPMTDEQTTRLYHAIKLELAGCPPPDADIAKYGGDFATVLADVFPDPYNVDTRFVRRALIRESFRTITGPAATVKTIGDDTKGYIVKVYYGTRLQCEATKDPKTGGRFATIEDAMFHIIAEANKYANSTAYLAGIDGDRSYDPANDPQAGEKEG